MNLVICTPCFGSPSSASVSLAYHEMTLKLLGSSAQFLPSTLFTNCDLVRARSRAVHIFLTTSTAEHLLFWDADVVPHDIRVLNAMIDAGKDIIGLPYPRKIVDYVQQADRVRDEAEQATRGRQTPEELEAAATQWSIAYDGVQEIGKDCLAKCLHVPAGFLVLRRSGLQRMVERYREELSFKDGSSGRVATVVGLFQLLMRGGVLYSEDYSFCLRARDMGIDVFAYLDPADHIGAHRFRGHWHGLVDTQA